MPEWTSPFINVNGITVTPSPSTLLLGLILDPKLQWFKHLEEKELNAKKIFHMDRRYVGKTWGLSQHRIKTIYTSLVESSLLYCCSVWASVLRTKRGCRKIRAIERQFYILKTKAFRTADAGALSILSGSYPIDYRIIEITLKRLYLSYSLSSLPFRPRRRKLSCFIKIL